MQNDETNEPFLRKSVNWTRGWYTDRQMDK